MTEEYTEKAFASLAITPENRILFLNENGQKEIDLNQMYQGYYPFCRFTDAAVCAGMLYVAGTDNSGVPHMYTSQKADAWSPVPISPKKSLITDKDYGDIVKILFDEASAQLFLVTHNGYLVTLPDCPQCVRARHISDLPLVDGKIDGKKIVMTDTSGETVCYSLYVAVEYRCAWSFAKPHLGKDGIVLDLQNTEEDTLPGAVRISAEEADMLLNHFPKETFLFFVCEFGRKADEAVRDARSMGFRNSYSLGSAYSVLQQIREESM